MRKRRARAPAAPPASGRVTTASRSPASSRWRRFRSSRRPRTPRNAGRSPIRRSRCPRSARSRTSTSPTSSAPRLSNGIPIVYARRTAVPVVRVAVEFDAGIAADPADALGTQALMLSLLDEGTTSRNSIQIAEEQERLGAAIGPDTSLDRTAVGLAALTPNLGPSLDLLADIIRNPAFEPGEVERLRAQQLSAIDQELTEPSGLGARTLPPLLFGADHPYGRPSSGTGDQGGGRPAHPRRSGPLPPELDPARQRHHLRGRRRAARRAGADARGAVRQLDSAGGAEGDQELRRDPADAEAADRARQPSAIAAVADPGGRRPAGPRHRRRSDSQRRQRGARRQLPVADQHGPARDQGLVLRLAQQPRHARAARPLSSSTPRSRPTRPDRRSGR